MLGIGESIMTFSLLDGKQRNAIATVDTSYQKYVGHGLKDRIRTLAARPVLGTNDRRRICHRTQDVHTPFTHLLLHITALLPRPQSRQRHSRALGWFDTRMRASLRSSRQELARLASRAWTSSAEHRHWRSPGRTWIDIRALSGGSRSPQDSRL